LYVKKYQTHVEHFQECNLFKIKTKQRSTRSPKTCHNFNPYQLKSIKINQNQFKSIEIIKK